MKIRKGDKVKILHGKDRGKIGLVMKTFPSQQKILVEGVNVVVRHKKPRGDGSRSGRIRMPMPIPVSKAMLIDPGSNKPTRVRIRRESGKAIRISVRSGKVISGAQWGKDSGKTGNKQRSSDGQISSHSKPNLRATKNPKSSDKKTLNKKSQKKSTKSRKDQKDKKK